MTEKNKHISALITSFEEKYGGIRKKYSFTAVFLFCSFLILGFLLLQFIESGTYFSATVKSLVLAFIVILSGVGAYFFHRYREFDSLKSFSSSFLAKRSLDGEKIANLIDLYSDGDQRSSVFYDAALNRNLESVQLEEIQQDLNRFSSNSLTHRRFLGSSSVMFLMVGAFFLSAFYNPDGLHRTATFWNSFEKPNPYQYTIDPGSFTVEHGQPVAPKITFEGNQIPENVSIALKTDVEENFRERPMNRLENNEFISNEIELTNSINYYIRMDEFQSESFRVDVQLQPRFEELTAKITPPSYTGLSESEHEYPFSDLEFYAGSTIFIEGKTNKIVDSLNLITKESQVSIETNDSLHYSHTYTPQASDTLRFEMTDNEGLKNRNPFRIVTHLLSDERPIVVIQEPASTVRKANPSSLDIIYQATDDFGLTSAEILWEKKRAFVNQPVTGSMSLGVPQNGQSTLFEWDLSEKDLRPRDELHFWIRARDNDEVGGYKWGESQRVTLTVPSLADSFEELDSKERDVQSELDNISDSFDQMEQEYERFIERLRQNPDGGFEEQEMLEDVTERQRDIDNAVKEMKDQFEQLRSEMNQSDKVSEETRKSYQELQQLMDELDDPDLQKALEELRRAMENMSSEQIEQALQNVTFNEELYKERLERTKELFKQIKMNTDLDRLAQQYEDLAERMKENPDATMEQLQQELDSVNEDIDQVSEQLENLDNNPPKRSEEQLKQIKEEAQQKLQEINSQMDELQQNMSDQMENGDSSPSEEMQQQQQQISEDLSEQAKKFRDSVQQMSGQQMQVNILALQRSLYTLLELSEAQENLTKRSTETQNRSQGFVELARQQNYVSNQFSAVADSIFEISAELPGIPNQVNRKKAEIEQVLQRSINEMSERNQRGATITTRESLGGINELSSTIASLLDQLMDQDQNGDGGGMSMEQMIENMQKMSGEQQELNQQLQDMVNDIQGDRLTREQSERLDQMARQQNEIRRQLQQMQQSGALRDGDQTLSELQRVLEEMEDSINDMRGGITDPMTIERQQNILSRMLNAEEAMDQRGEEEEREGARAEQMAREFPPEMTLEELKQEIRSRLQDPNYTKFSDEYQQLIQRYFEQLRRFDENILP